jgi:hypothetical protein
MSARLIDANFFRLPRVFAKAGGAEHRAIIMPIRVSPGRMSLEQALLAPRGGRALLIAETMLLPGLVGQVRQARLRQLKLITINMGQHPLISLGSRSSNRGNCGTRRVTRPSLRASGSGTSQSLRA